MIRHAFFAGTWYPSVKKEIEQYISPASKKVKAIAVVCPHAGWIYSGKTAGKVFSRVQPAGLNILIGPNHRGGGASVSVYPEGAWQTPLGELEIDKAAASEIVSRSKFAKPDASAHDQEHSLEVQTPFIKFTNPDARIVPICMNDYSPSTCRDLGLAVAGAISSQKNRGSSLIVASSDMSHYVSASAAKIADGMAIEKILKLDPAGLLKVVEENNITMCGSGPVASALWAAKELGATGAELVAYSTSGDVTGDDSEVVGYAGLIIY